MLIYDSYFLTVVLKGHGSVLVPPSGKTAAMSVKAWSKRQQTLKYNKHYEVVGTIQISAVNTNQSMPEV